jgi:predicted ABC-type ATPase
VPLLTLIAGPNGSGKSTLTAALDFEGRDRLVDADAIARRLNPANPAAAAIESGRAVLRCTDEYLSRGQSFAIEMTLASRNYASLIKNAKSCGFQVHLLYVCVNTVARSLSRVSARVAKGGHFIPDDDVRRRYIRSIANCKEAIRLVNEAHLYDNSGNGHHLVLIARGGEIVWRANLLPGWLDI